MKEFEKVEQKDLIIEFFKNIDENLYDNIVKLEVEEYIDSGNSIFYKRKSLLIKLNNCDYWVNLYYDVLGKETTFTIYKPVYRERKNTLYETIKQITRKIK